MIDEDTFKELLESQGFSKERRNVLTKSFGSAKLAVDFNSEQIKYPENKGLKVNGRQICNFQHEENFVVLECVHRLLEKGYKPEHLEIEPRWKVGHGASGGRADILVKDQTKSPLLLIECKTAGNEFEKAWRETQRNGGQLFSYAQQIPQTQFLCLYAVDFADGRITTYQKIISHKDNQTILERAPKSISFADAVDVESRFAVWRDTYQLEFVESGIFEDNIQPYQIGKSKYAFNHDTRPIKVAETTGQYNKFRTILRQHNIARRENAFEVLVNLFLCKIVDEESNKENLKFYWKGLAYDNYFDFVDRLQDLYQTGMQKFLNEEISYISNEQIEKAFWAVKNDRNATKKKIQEYFRELKFFTNSAFSFVDTHNEKLFNKNARVLVAVVQMWQGLRLTTEEPNQFLGDMFEYFLDNGIKQSNGQFFTPLPICKFIVSSLPLAQKIKDHHDPLKVIDYACGAGHFLTEYAHQIKSLVANGRIHEYYTNIIGIEKEDRLVKVAKVAAYMHGQRQITILDVDALSQHDQVQAESFDVLVANPPFSVKGFLHTLSDDDKKYFQLIKAIGERSDTNAIQCFFLERTCQLMAPGGVVGVIVPSSILSNTENVYVRTRELLLQYFDTVSIVELGSGTFGKTGTNTVILFLRRKSQRPEPAEHYKNRAEDFFEGDKEGDIYQDEHLVKAYCRHVNVPYDKFKASKQDNWLPYRKEVEKDKLYYFMLAHEQPERVLVVKSPTNKNQQKEFLGYEWSNRKGTEGIKYMGGDTVNDIVTPLFDPNNLDNSERINTAIRNNFNGVMTESLPPHCHYARLIDVLDFSGDDFHKTINLNPQKNTVIQSKWEMVTLGDVAEVKKGTSITKKDTKEGNIKVVAGGIDYAYFHNVSNRLENTITVSASGANAGYVNYWNEPIFASDCTTVRGQKGVLSYYIFCFMRFIQNDIFNLAKGAAQPHVYPDDIKQIKIPIPPLVEQKKIVGKCEAVDREVEKAQNDLNATTQQIEQAMQSVASESKWEMVMLGDVAEVKKGTSITKKDTKEGNIKVVAGGIDYAYFHNVSNRLENTITVSASGANAGYVNYWNEPIFASDCTTVRGQKGVLSYYIFCFMRFIQNDIFNLAKGVAQPHVYPEDIKQIEIPLPPLNTQKQLVTKVKKLQTKIAKAQAVIDDAVTRKKSILEKHL